MTQRTFLVCWVLDGSENRIDRVTVSLPADADRDTVQDALYGALAGTGAMNAAYVLDGTAFISHAIELSSVAPGRSVVSLDGVQRLFTFPPPR